MRNATVRVEAFSDGVFAIAATLLVLGIKIPPAESINSVEELWKELAHLWPSYFSFVLSFGFILVSWVNHHAISELIDRASPQILFANGFLLLNIVFLPFATALLSEYVDSDFRQPAIVLYCLSYVVQNVSWNLLFAAISQLDAVKSDATAQGRLKRVVKFSRAGFAIYVMVAVLAWWFPLVALALNTTLWFMWLILGLTASSSTVS